MSLFTQEVSNGSDLNKCFDSTWERKVLQAQEGLLEENVDENSPINASNIKAALRKIKKRHKKAAGRDGITNWMMTWAGENLIKPLLTLFKGIWNNNLVPTFFRQVDIKYIFKGKGQKTEISGYRPISLISCLGKVYTLTWLPQLQKN